MIRKRDSWKIALSLLLCLGIPGTVLAEEFQKIEVVVDKSSDSVAENNMAFGIGLSGQGAYESGTNFEINVTLIGGNAECMDSSADTSAQGYGILNERNLIETGNNRITLNMIGGFSKSPYDALSAAIAGGIVNTGVVKTGNNIIHINATSGFLLKENPSGGYAYVDAWGLVNQEGTILTEDNIIVVKGVSQNNTPNSFNFAMAGGIVNHVGDLTTGRNHISVSVEGTEPGFVFGILANNGEVNVKGAQTIYTEALRGEGSGIQTEPPAYALISGLGKLTLDSQGEAVQLTGDIGSGPAGSITVALDQKDSYWRPRFQSEFMDIANGSFGEGSLTIRDGGVLDLAWSANQRGAKFLDNHLNLTGENITIAQGATFVINSDLANNQADTVTAEGASVTGTQYVRVAYDPSYLKEEDVFGRALVLNFEGANGQGVRTLTEFGLEDVYVTPVMDGGYLIALLRDQYASELGMTASEIYQHQINLFRLQGNSLMRRLGDLRQEHPKNRHNVWARTYGGKLKSEGAYGRHSSQKYYAVQAGYDYRKERRNGTYLYGALLNYIDSDSSFSRGDGDIKSLALGGYVSWLGRKGHYADVVLRAVHMDTDYRLHSLRGEKISADFSNWGYLLSTEYGYRKVLPRNTFLEPQMELLLGHLSSESYTSSNGVRLHQDGVNLAIGRLGILYGIEFGREKKSNAYVKGSVVHDFSGSGDLTGSYNGQRQVLETGGATGTSFELNLGTNWNLSEHNHIYAELTKSFGGDVEMDWQVNVGWRMNW